MDMSADAAALNALAKPAPAGPSPMATGGGQDGADGAVALRDLTVMMIDDEPMLTEVIGTYLEDAGYRHVVGINDATVALQKVRELNPALVLLDLVMPGVSGFEILQALRQDEQLRYTPVIVLTAASDPDTKLKSLSIGATEFLAKPVDPSELVLRVRNSLVLKVYQDRLANSDPVTGLPNRRVVMERLRGIMAQGLADSGKVGLLHVRMDRLQQLQATLGQSAGDELLRAAALRMRGTRDWLAALEAAGVPCGPINDLAQVHAEPQVLHRGLRFDLPHPLGCSVPQVANPVRYSRTPLEYRDPPPLLGQHTDRVLEAELGLDAAARAALRARGAIG